VTASCREWRLARAAPQSRPVASRCTPWSAGADKGTRPLAPRPSRVLARHFDIQKQIRELAVRLKHGVPGAQSVHAHCLSLYTIQISLQKKPSEQPHKRTNSGMSLLNHACQYSCMRADTHTATERGTAQLTYAAVQSRPHTVRGWVQARLQIRCRGHGHFRDIRSILCGWSRWDHGSRQHSVWRTTCTRVAFPLCPSPSAA